MIILSMSGFKYRRSRLALHSATKMHFATVFSLALASLFVACSSQCQVCVLEPLFTSGVKCPLCSKNAFRGSGIDSRNARKDGLEIFGDYDRESNRQTNWTTCSLEAQPCDPSSKYRTFDGSCNNLNEPTQGMTNSVYIRLLPANYGDGKHGLPVGSDGQPKPLARALRTDLFPDRYNPDRAALSVMQFGQLVAHDIIASAAVAGSGARDCCSPANIDDQSVCLPIRVPEDDYFYSQYNVTCQNLARNDITLIGDCDENQAGQQYNSVTHALDGSMVYGSDVESADSLREFVGGRLRVQCLPDGRAFPPNLPLEQIQTKCFARSDDEPCYDAGDRRINNNPQLAILQILLLREHNRIATGLQQLHSDWNDEKIYQEARAIVAAMIQHITYNEWLVYYIGDSNMRMYDLYPNSWGYTEYNSMVNLASINSFVAAAYRFPHSGIQGFLKMLNYQRQLQREIPISDWMLRPLIVQESSNFDQLLTGMINQPMQIFDQYFTEQITNLMFHNTAPHGVDLMSIDIERGRDHGLAPYVDYLELCLGYKAESFDDLYRIMSAEFVEKLRTHYKSVRDIDLIVGGGLEAKVGYTRFGPTFLCIITEQFYRKKFGDRFWYEVGGQPNSFSEAQLHEIRKVTFSRIICDNSDNITNIALNSFEPPSATNPLIPCGFLAPIDLSKW